ncbi:hypothetical protein PFISCL1PPCAC_17986, partial [Pristionchus fissidentatus]
TTTTTVKTTTTTIKTTKKKKKKKTTTATTTTTQKPTTAIIDVWTEWVTTGHCLTTCGSCNVAHRTRTCKYASYGCTCSSDVGPCGIALCPWPTPTCCGQYIKCLN